MDNYGIIQTHRVEKGMTDGKGLLRLSSLFTLFQDIAGDHSALLDCSADQLQERGYFWAVTNYKAQIARLPEEGEELTLETCVGRPAHAIFPRYFRLFDGKGEPLALCASRWALVDVVKRTAAAGAPGFEAFNGPKDPWGLKDAGPVRPAAAERHVDFSLPPEYIDRNGHMNNARYFEMAELMLGGDIEGFVPCFAAMEYRSELLPGVPMKVGIGSIDPAALDSGAQRAFYLFGESEEAQIFRMKLGYRPK